MTLLGVTESQSVCDWKILMEYEFKDKIDLSDNGEFKISYKLFGSLEFASKFY